MRRARRPPCPRQRGWPHRDAAIRTLKNIGDLYEQRFAAEGLHTLRQLERWVRRHTRHQNTTMFQRVFLNERRDQCVPRSQSAHHLTQTKEWDNPWPQPPYIVLHRNRHIDPLRAGHFSYCVPRYNRCAWETVERYLRHALRHNRRDRIPRYPGRRVTEYCRNLAPTWCREGSPEPSESSSESSSSVSTETHSSETLSESRSESTESESSQGMMVRITPYQSSSEESAGGPSAGQGQQPSTGSEESGGISPAAGQGQQPSGESTAVSSEESGEQSSPRPTREQENLARLLRVIRKKQGGGGGKPRTIRYHLSTPSKLRRHAKSLRYWVHRALDDRVNGIASVSNVTYKEVPRKRDADIVVRLSPQSEINKKCGFENLSCSQITPGDETVPDEIMFSLENWMGGSDYDGPLSDYRKYLVNHEFLHCTPFHLDHPSRDSVRRHCDKHHTLPVMYQQSRGLPPYLPDCTYNSWPSPDEIKI